MIYIIYIFFSSWGCHECERTKKKTRLKLNAVTDGEDFCHAHLLQPLHVFIHESSTLNIRIKLSEIQYFFSPSSRRCVHSSIPGAGIAKVTASRTIFRLFFFASTFAICLRYQNAHNEFTEIHMIPSTIFFPQTFFFGGNSFGSFANASVARSLLIQCSHADFTCTSIQNI